MRLLIAIPSHDMIHAEFVKCLMKMMDHLRMAGITAHAEIKNGTLVYYARDRLAQMAVNDGWDWTLWLDSDMVFPETLAEDLLDNGKDMVCGNYISRHNPYLPVIFRRLEPPERMEAGGIAPFQVAGCGFAAVLVKTDVLKAVMQQNAGQCFVPTPNLSEDLAFCRRVWQSGTEIWCDPTARVGHIGQIAIWPEDGERLRSDIQNIDRVNLN